VLLAALLLTSTLAAGPEHPLAPNPVPMAPARDPIVLAAAPAGALALYADNSATARALYAVRLDATGAVRDTTPLRLGTIEPYVSRVYAAGDGNDWLIAVPAADHVRAMALADGQPRELDAIDGYLVALLHDGVSPVLLVLRGGDIIALRLDVHGAITDTVDLGQNFWQATFVAAGGRILALWQSDDGGVQRIVVSDGGVLHAHALDAFDARVPASMLPMIVAGSDRYVAVVQRGGGKWHALWFGGDDRPLRDEVLDAQPKLAAISGDTLVVMERWPLKLVRAMASTGSATLALWLDDKSQLVAGRFEDKDGAVVSRAIATIAGFTGGAAVGNRFVVAWPEGQQVGTAVLDAAGNVIAKQAVAMSGTPSLVSDGRDALLLAGAQAQWLGGTMLTLPALRDATAAWNGDGFVIASEASAAPRGIVGVSVAASGIAFGPAFPLSTGANDVTPALARFRSGLWLAYATPVSAAYPDAGHRIALQRLSQWGWPDGQPETLAPGDSSQPRLAVSGDTLLALWLNGNTIRGARFDASGARLDNEYGAPLYTFLGTAQPPQVAATGDAWWLGVAGGVLRIDHELRTTFVPLAPGRESVVPMPVAGVGGILLAYAHDGRGYTSLVAAGRGSLSPLVP
jgi:hypothetical protein